MFTSDLLAPFIVPFASLVGVVIGFLGGLFSTLFVERSKREAVKRQLASAFAGEIFALMEIAKARGIKESLQRGLDYYKGGNKFNYWSFPMSEDYFRMYKQNVDKIGLLPVPLPSKLATFYTLSFGIVEDLKSLGEHIKLNNAPWMIQIFTEDIAIIVRIEELACELLHELEQTSGVKRKSSSRMS